MLVETAEPAGSLSLIYFVSGKRYFRIHSSAGVLTQQEDICVPEVSVGSIFYSFFSFSETDNGESRFAISPGVFPLNVFPQAGFYRVVTC